jgi:dipeptidyl aminopeptidase/acylaminoacyl peptidase
MKNFILTLLLMSFYLNSDAQQTGYQVPPKEILQLAEAQPAPIVFADKESKFLILLARPAYKSLEELTEDELKLAGIRINPANFNTARTNYYKGLEIVEIATGKKLTISGLPSKIRIEYPGFSPKNTYFTFVNVLADGLELWTVEIKTGKAKKITNANLSAVLGTPYFWSPDEKTMYCRWVENKAVYSTAKELPTGPAIQEATGSKAPARTFQDLLKNPNDEKKFDHYAACAIVKFDLASAKMQMTTVLPKGIYRAFSISPNGKFLLSSEVGRPYSYTLPYNRFPYRTIVYDNKGKSPIVLIDKPLQDKIPQGFSAVEAGKRQMAWRNDQPETLYWAEAQDEGDPTKDVKIRDYIYQLQAPFQAQPSFLVGTLNRYSGIAWGDANTAVVEDFWWKNRNQKTYLIDPSKENKEPRVLFDLSSEDSYADPGGFSTEFNEAGRAVLKINKGKMYLEGEGYTPEGNRPFLDEFEMASGTKKRLWQADGKSTYEQLIDVIDLEKGVLLTRIESPKVYPNFHLRTIGQAETRQLTTIENPYKALEGVTKQKIFYKRNDGVDLSATLYTPAGWSAKDGKLPVLMEAYPTEYKDSKAAGQIKESPHRFVGINWASPVFWAMRGYAILQDAQFPIIGKDKEEPNDTYITQLVANADAAIKKVDSMGVGDAKRVAVMGHSYGAFMTANLLAHSSLFAAGIARSGAYNRSLTPFGFQSEERNYWEAMKVYNDMAPFNFADKIKTPILMIHGDADNNPGTFTLQSERMFQAIKGLGGVARLVLLPNESHGYAAKENIFHMLWEMDTWMEKYVKNKK